MEKAVLVFDCGATNLRAIAIDRKGNILSSKSFPNQSHDDPHHTGGRIWNLDEIIEKLCEASREVMKEIDPKTIVAVTTSSFGVDGTFINEEGDLLYPVISWQCERTSEVMKRIDRYIPLEELYGISGINAYSFNTINKLIWFRENLPKIPEKAERFLFMPSLINFFLTGKRINDTTMLGTSMLTSLGNRSLSMEILGKIGYQPEIFGEIAEPGTIAGHITEEAALKTGIPAGTTVSLAGHDTQFSIFGSGAGVNQPVLSSGTWEILMARSAAFSTSEVQLKSGITTEFDALPGFYDIGMNWLASGIVEWVRKMFFPECDPDNCYEVMMKEAAEAGIGANGIFINPDFHNFVNSPVKGEISGLTMNTTRGEIIRAVFEALSFRLRMALEALERAGNFKAEKVLCVGGGSKNSLWNQIRADALNKPVETIGQCEITVLGASFFAFTAARIFTDPSQGRSTVTYDRQVIHPCKDHKQYDNLYHQWKRTIHP